MYISGLKVVVEAGTDPAGNSPALNDFTALFVAHLHLSPNNCQSQRSIRYAKTVMDRPIAVVQCNSIGVKILFS